MDLKAGGGGVITEWAYKRGVITRRAYKRGGGGGGLAYTKANKQ